MKIGIVRIILCVGVIVCVIISCKNKEMEEVSDIMENTMVFNEGFYENLKAISLVGTGIIIEDKEIIENIKQLILGVSYSESTENILNYYGTTILVMIYNDGSSKTVSMTSEYILDRGNTYELETDICSQIRAYFN